MKRFLILLLSFMLLLSIPVFAKSMNDADVYTLLEFTNSTGNSYYYVYQKTYDTMRSVYFQEENAVRVFNGTATEIYLGGCNIEDFPRDFYSNELKASSKLDTSTTGAPFVLYTWNNSTMSGLGTYTDVSVYADYTYASKAEFYEALKDYNSWDEFVTGADSFFNSNSGDYLPLPTFKIKQAWTVADIGGTVKYTFNWKVGEHDIYASNPNKYKIQMLATAKYREETTSGTSTVVADELTYIYPECNFYIDNAIPIYKESYSFLEREARNKLCDIAGVNKNNSSETSSFFYLFVRVIEPETGKTSLWKVYKCQGRNIAQSGYYDDDGNQYAGDKDDEIDDSASYDSDPSTDAADSPTSSFYNDGAEIDAQHLLNNLEEIVSTLNGIPDLFQKVFLWMPDYLIVLIATSIGLIIVIGFVKMFIR